MGQKFNIETDDTSEHMRLVAVARLFDRNYYYDPENIGEVINDGVKTAIKMVREVNRIMKAEPSCLKWIDSQLLYDLSVVSNLMKEVYSTAMTVQEEWEMQTTSNGKETAESENGHVDGGPTAADEEGIGILEDDGIPF